jgi:lipoprotein NlpD
MSVMHLKVNRWSFAWMLSAALLVAGCSGPTKRTVVVEDRPVGKAPSAPAPVNGRPSVGEAVAASPSGVPPSAESASNAGKPGFYTVKPGDTLVRIGLDHGQNWRDIVRWNQIENPNVIEVGQVLRVRPEPGAARPVARPSERVERPSAGASGSPPLSSATPGASGAAPSAGRSGSTTASAGSAPEPARDSTAEAVTADVNWAWPAAGPVLQGFDDQRNKGLDIGGKAGDPVLAAAEGRVVYAGSALRGYGNLVILKHNGTFLSAYAHNQTLLVKEDQVVKRGQKIAEMGSTDAERIQLHFEIRRDGKPVDPARYLPAR